MKNTRIGNWLITKNEVRWSGNGEWSFKIPLSDFDRRKPNTQVFEWLVIAASKEWICELDLFALNTVFLYCLDRFEINLEKASFVHTYEEQKYLLSKRESYSIIK